MDGEPLGLQPELIPQLPQVETAEPEVKLDVVADLQPQHSEVEDDGPPSMSIAEAAVETEQPFESLVEAAGVLLDLGPLVGLSTGTESTKCHWG